MKDKRGKLIVIEGIDGSGKTLQTKMLLRRLKREGHDTATIDFPQYEKNFFGGLVARYLRGEFGTATEIHPGLVSVIYACDRWESAPQIKQWLDSGKVIVANRYVSANMGHQGGKLKEPEERTRFLRELEKMEYEVFKVPRPDLVILLKLRPEIAQRLIDKKDKRHYTKQKRDAHEASLSHLENTLECFLEIAKQNPDTWKVIDCNNCLSGGVLSPKIIRRRIWQTVKHILNKV